MNSNMCYGKGGHMDAPVIPSLRPRLGSTAMTDQPTSDEDASISQRLFGKVISPRTQVCKGPCVNNDMLAFAFAQHG